MHLHARTVVTFHPEPKAIGKRFASVAIGLAALLSASANAYDGNLTRTINTSGTSTQILGKSDANNTHAFLGIPFAKPPTSSLRWRATQNPVAWSGVRDATFMRSQCAQVSSFFSTNPNPDSFGKTVVGSEDCLYLNVWRPNTAADDLPVMIWIHGGSNRRGSATEALYNAARFAARNNVVVVTVQYRMGLIGWMWQSALKNGTALDNSGNFATLDLIKALDWVQTNAAAFGGNRSRVTVAGHSAGCINVWGLMQSPMAAGKFHRAICLAGFPSAQNGPLQGQPVADKLVNQLLVDANAKKLDGDPTKKINYTLDQADVDRRAMSATDIRALMYAASAEQLMKYTPAPAVPNHFTDGTVIPSSIAGVPQWVTCNFNKVPMMIGTTRDDGSFFLRISSKGIHLADDKTLWNMINYNNPVPTVTNLIHADWRGDLFPFFSPKFKVTHRTITSAVDLIIDNTMRTANLCNPGQFYRFHLNWDNVVTPWNDVLGPMHGSDVAFMFGNFETTPNVMKFLWTTGTATERNNLSLLMNKYMSNFMRNGSPGNAGSGTAEWTVWTNFTLPNKRMLFDYEGSTNRSVMSSDEYLQFTIEYPLLPLDAKAVVLETVLFTGLPDAINPFKNGQM